MCNHVNLFLEDPLDSHYVELGQSLTGQGAFAKVDIKAGTLFSLFGGMILNEEQRIQLDKELNELEMKNGWMGGHPETGNSWKYRYETVTCSVKNLKSNFYVALLALLKLSHRCWLHHGGS